MEKMKKAATVEVKAEMPGPVSLFRGKDRMPISVGLTPGLKLKAKRGARRLGLSRSDFIALLIEKHGDTVAL